jgi:hypothetical protein
MKLLLAALLLVPAAARAAESTRACVKWSRPIPDAVAAGAGLFASVARVDAKGPYPDCDVVVEAESFGVGWLMSAWMKEAVLSPCGKRLGGYKFRYKGDQWQEKAVSGLRDFLDKNPAALAAAKDCPAAVPPPPTVPAPPVAISTAPLTPSLPAEPVIPSTATAK